MIPHFEKKEQLFCWLRANKQFVITAKKAITKHADPVDYVAKDVEDVTKGSPEESTEMNALLVINTTNIVDSHDDLHVPGLWKKSLSERKSLYLLQEHKMQFDKIITDKVKAFTRTMTFAELGQNYPGTTEALIFQADITKERNAYMFGQYLKGYVRNHSVGMQYVKIELAMDSDDRYDQEEKAVWDKYFGMIANVDEVKERGYFWAVTEAKLIEGSAVPIGSNWITPTLEINPKSLDIAELITTPEPTAQDIINHIKRIKIN
jgi:hypothetical protein